MFAHKDIARWGGGRRIFCTVQNIPSLCVNVCSTPMMIPSVPGCTS